MNSTNDKQINKEYQNKSDNNTVYMYQSPHTSETDDGLYKSVVVPGFVACFFFF